MEQWTEKDVEISEIATLLNAGYEIEALSPDGYVPVASFVDKGLWKEYILNIDGMTPVQCNENHLFETSIGWHSAIELVNKGTINFLTIDGYRKGIVTTSDILIPIVDIEIDHPNHRYYTNGVSSHNTGVGKSLAMCHMAAACLSQGKNVLYITLELAEERVAERIDSNLMNVTMDDLKDLPRDTYLRLAKNVKNKANGKLIIEEYPTAAASTIHFEALLNELRLKKNFVPDIIFVDYLNICMSARVKPGANINSYTYVKAIAEELRGLAVKWNVPIVSATQTTRSGFSNSDPGLEDTSESFGLPATADWMIALVSTDDLNALNQILVKQLKSRYGDITKNKKFVIGIDRAKMRLYDVDASAQADISDSGQDEPETKASKYQGIKVPF